MKTIEFDSDGDSPVPGVGTYERGDRRTLPADIAQAFIDQGSAHEVQETMQASAPDKEA